MKKSVIIFAMLSGAIAFISCEENNLIKSQSEVVMDSIYTSSDSVSVPSDTITTIPGDSSDTVPKDTVGTHDITIELADEEFILTPSFIDSASVRGIGINIAGTRSYKCLNSYLYFNSFYQEPDSKVFKMRLLRVIQPGVKYCQEGEKTMSASTFIYPLTDGYSYFEIELNETIYKGTIINTGNIYTIIWPYTKGIKFSKLTLTR